jgi:hypothetical protein
MEKNKRNIVVISLVIVLILINLPYIMTFSHGFSDASSDWANYSTFISGLLNPIISLIGIYLIYKEYTKSSANRNEDKLLKRIEFVENDLAKILNRNVYYKVRSKEENTTLIQFLRFNKLQSFFSITVEREIVYI